MQIKLIIVAIFYIIFFSSYCIAQSDSTLTLEQINHYSDQSKQLISYLEGTVNFLGDPNELPSDKDMIINNSFLKIFASDKVQIEDDLDENRKLPLNKDVQAYLKDIDFFYKKVNFGFEIEKTEQLVTDSGVIVFKFTLNRHLEGITVNNDTVNNNQLRFIEINLDPLQRDLKIASIYTTKVREKEELKYWWNNMPTDWKNFFGKSIIVYDTLPFKNIIEFSDSTIITMKWAEVVSADTIIVVDDINTDPVLLAGDTALIVYETGSVMVLDTIKVNTSTIYRILNTLKSIRRIDLSDNLIIRNLIPVSELTDLVEINISNTLIEDLSPIRNLNKLEIFNCSGSPVTALEPLRYVTTMKELYCSNTSIERIGILSNMEELSELDLSNSSITSLDALRGLNKLAHLKISKTNVTNLSPLNNLSSLSDLNISNTKVKTLTTIDSLISLQNLNIDNTHIYNLQPISYYTDLSILQANNTSIADLNPLSNLSLLKVIYCDNSNVTMAEANRFMDANPQCLVIYNSQELINWWNALTVEWKDIFRTKFSITPPVTKEKLHQLINQTSLSVAYNRNIHSLQPLRMLHRLEELDIQNTSISDLTPLSGLNNLETLNLNETNVNTLEPLSSLHNLKQISFENTEIDELKPLSGSNFLEIIYCDKSKIKAAKALSFKNMHNSCLIIYQSQKLRLWWDNLDAVWEQMFIDQFNLSANPSNEELQELVDLTALEIKNNVSLNNLTPLHIFVRLEQLTVSNTSITDISPITSLTGLKKLNISSNPIFDLGLINKLTGLEELSIENTSVEDLEPISGLKRLISLNIAGTRMKSLKYIQGLNNLEKLYINNTRIKSLKPIIELSKLMLLQCYNTSIRSSRVEEFKISHPQTEVVFY
ncbi:MAG TPA: hypothetical protein QF480_09435 [Bacteroidales bacterium]|jgi:Leucine-rich repeat (LRR) protein|nr:hypothetical protein [Bacteroidota bacterium]HJN06825.1 hypothetical protein [Bacteroidales bacterium]